MRLSLPDVSFDLLSLSTEKDEFFDQLLEADDLQDVLYLHLNYELPKTWCIKYPLERSRMGYRVDALFKFCGLHWTPEIGSGEVSGGLPRCTIAKEWMDTIKLG
ncbi:26471_t:CDS:2, partial [Gigaspora margarita]